MPITSVIVGVDLAPIKPIPRVITHVEDITTASCRSTIKRDLKDWKADVVLHDGAPNVGTAWVQDAYAQSELVLHALKLAVEFLGPKGTFVTKVFRSKNYNHLMYIFNQLFEKVEATKPHSSRNVSAEIFVVCQGFKAPKKLDSKFLDPQYVFREVDEASKEMSENHAKNAILYPEKEALKRKRDGYAENDYTLHHSDSVLNFLQSSKEAEAVKLLAYCNKLDLSSREGEECENDAELLEKIKSHKSTTEEILSCLEDLKVLGRKDYKSLLKWRLKIRQDIFKKESKDDEDENAEPAEAEAEAADSDDSDKMMEELENLVASAEAAEKKAKKKRLQKLAKEKQRLQLNMVTPKDIGLEASANMIDDLDFDGAPGQLGSQKLLFDPKSASAVKGDYAEGDMDEHLLSTESEFSSDEEVEADSDIDSEEETLNRLNSEVDQVYEFHQQRLLEKDPKLKIKKIRAQEEEFTGIKSDDSDKENDSDASEYGGNMIAEESDLEGSISNDFMSDEEEEPASKVEENEESKSWFQQSLFDELDEEEEDSHIKEQPKAKKQKTEKKKKIVDDASDDEDGFDDEVDDKESKRAQEELRRKTEALSTAEAVSLAVQMVQDGGRMKRDLIDEFGYRKNVFGNLDDLPAWFAEDERRHNKPNIPITKEAIRLIRERQTALDARPIKKVVEAKARKKQKAMRKLEKISKKLNQSVEEGGADDPELTSKIGNAHSVMKKALRKAKSDLRRKVQLVVAKGSSRGKKTRPNGVKGRYKMVDGRMKKEVRAEKIKQKKSKGRK